MEVGESFYGSCCRVTQVKDAKGHTWKRVKGRRRLLVGNGNGFGV